MRTRIQYWPHAAQALVHKAPQRQKAAVCGARSGKTLSFAAEAVSHGITQPGFTRQSLLTGEPYLIGIGAPTYPMIDRVILPQLLRLIPESLRIGKFHTTKRLLRMQGMFAETHFYLITGSNPEAWQGQDLNGAWLDEFAIMKEQMYDEAQVRTSNKKGWLLLSGTPKGPNWAKTRVYDYSQTPEGEKEIFFTSWTTADNPYFPADELERKRRSMPPKFYKRMFEATWDTFEGQIYDEFDRETHLKDAKRYRFQLPSGQVVGSPLGDAKLVKLTAVVAGVDWGFNHPGAITVAGKDKTGRWWILDFTKETDLLVQARKPSDDSWTRRAFDLQLLWQIERFYCGHERPENIRIFRNVGLQAIPAITNRSSVWDGLQVTCKFMHVDPVTNRTRLFFLDTSNVAPLVEEVIFYHWKMLADGTQTEEPDKVDDDGCDSMRYAIFTHEQMGGFKREPNFQVHYQPAM